MESVSMLLPDVADRRDFTAVVIHMPYRKTKSMTCLCDYLLYSGDPSQLSDALNNAGCCMRLQSASFLGLALPGSRW